MPLVARDFGRVKIGTPRRIAPTLRTKREEWGTHFNGYPYRGKDRATRQLPILSADKVLDAYNVRRLW